MAAPIRTRYATTRERRIEIIARRMRDKTYVKGLTTAELAQEWQVPQWVAEKAASEAAVVLRLARKLFNEDLEREVLARFRAYLATA